MTTRNCFAKLLQRPVCGRMRRHVVVKNAAAADLHRHEYKQHPESSSDRNQEIAGHDPLGMILDERPPMLRSSLPTSCITRLGQYFRTVRGETQRPNFNESSAAMRSSPQVTFSFTIRAMSWRISFGSAGRPPRDFQRQYNLKPLRCQRMNVSGVTTASASFQSKKRDQSTSDKRAASVSRRGLISCSW